MQIRKVWLASMVVVALIATACGSSKKSSSTTATTAKAGSTNSSGGQATPTSVLSGATYTVGIGARLTGPSALAYAGAAPVGKAWQDWVNSHGGINGHPVKVVVEDTGGDAAKGLAAMKDLVENKGALAFIPVDSSIDNALVSYSQQQGVAVVEAYAAYPIWNTTPGWFALGVQSSPYSTLGALKIGQDAGAKSLAAVVCAEVAACASVDPVLTKNAPSYGVRYDGVLKVSQTAADYTAACLALKEKGSAVIFAGVSPTAVGKLASDCGAQGYKPSFVMSYHSFGPPLTQIPNFTTLAFEPTVPWYADIPAMANFRAAMNADGDLSKADETSMFAWTSLEAFKQGAANLGDNPTKQSFLQGMYQVKNFTAGGLVPPVSFTPGQPSPIGKCYYVGAVTNGSFTLPQGPDFKCVS